MHRLGVLRERNIQRTDRSVDQFSDERQGGETAYECTDGYGHPPLRARRERLCYRGTVLALFSVLPAVPDIDLYMGIIYRFNNQKRKQYCHFLRQ